ncbi:MAG: hypothetical protein R3F36_12755 [Candidatus Competibacteraceae bacterium]
MAIKVHVDIVSARRNCFPGWPRWWWRWRSWAGGHLPGHSPFLARLKPGQVRTTESSEETQVFYISSGLLKSSRR